MTKTTVGVVWLLVTLLAASAAGGQWDKKTDREDAQGRRQEDVLAENGRAGRWRGLPARLHHL